MFLFTSENMWWFVLGCVSLLNFQTSEAQGYYGFPGRFNENRRLHTVYPSYSEIYPSSIGNTRVYQSSMTGVAFPSYLSSGGGFQGGVPTGGSYQGSVPTGEGYQGSVNAGGGYQTGVNAGGGYQSGVNVGRGYQGSFNDGGAYQGGVPTGVYPQHNVRNVMYPTNGVGYPNFVYSGTQSFNTAGGPYPSNVATGMTYPVNSAVGTVYQSNGGPGVMTRKFSTEASSTVRETVESTSPSNNTLDGTTLSYNGTVKQQKVYLDIYYETNCPDSKRFVTDQLAPVYKDFKDILEVVLVPFGKGQALFDAVSKKYQFQCHHGPAECYGNTVQGCAMSLHPDVETHLNFIDCMESYPRPSDNGQKCARRQSLDWKSISKCADGEEGQRILYKNAEVTKALQPPVTFVPWINVNKVHNYDIQWRSLRDLKSVVCEAFKAPHPKC